jgi:hypothetical protein
MLNIAPIHAVLGKISNNIENHGDEEVTAFDIPVTGILLDREQLNALLDDSVADRVLFNKTRTGDVQPSLKCFAPFVLTDSFDGAVLSFSFGEAKKENFTLRDCKVKGVTLEPQNGGNTVVSLKIRVRPENDSQILMLMGHQNRGCQLGIAEAKVATTAAAKKQGGLFDTSEGGDDPDAENGTDADQERADAQAAGFERGTPNGSRPRNGAH